MEIVGGFQEPPVETRERIAGAGGASFGLAVVLSPLGPRPIWLAAATVLLFGVPFSSWLDRRVKDRVAAPHLYGIAGAVGGTVVGALLTSVDSSFGTLYIPVSTTAGLFAAVGARTIAACVRPGAVPVLAPIAPLTLVVALAWDIVTAT